MSKDTEDDIIVAIDDEDDLDATSDGDKEDTLEGASYEESSSEEDSEPKKGKRDRGAERRIAQLTAKQRAAEERAEMAEARLRESEANLARLVEDAGMYIDHATGAEEAALTSAIAGAKSKYRKAAEDGDFDAQTEATDELTRLHGALSDVTRRKDAKKRYLAEQEKRKKATGDAQGWTPQENGATHIPEPSEKALAWRDKNTEWFGKDAVMTNAALTIHSVLVGNEGYDPESDEYYEELDARLREHFPEKMRGAGKAPKRGRGDQLVAGASRGSPQKKSVTVKLSASELAMADDLGMTPEQYAREKAKLEKQRGMEA